MTEKKSKNPPRRKKGSPKNGGGTAKKSVRVKGAGVVAKKGSRAKRAGVARVFHILVINPGSTSTKLSLFQNERERYSATESHSAREIGQYPSILDQEDFRLRHARAFLTQHRIDSKRLDAVVGRGGLLRPIESGVYRVNGLMLSDLRAARFGEHASNLGALLAWRIAEEAGRPAFIVDPVVVDEMEETARITGIPEIRRRSIFHALNQKSAAREVARRLGKPYEKCNLIVAHLGGGISVGAHRKGRVVDVNNALDGEGPFAPERAGSIPAGQLVEICFSGRFSLEEIKSRLTGRGGLVAYRGSSSLEELKRADDGGDRQAKVLFAALALRISQEICRHGATFEGKVDAVILTGGMARESELVALVKKRVRHLGPVAVIPGEREMLALAEGALSVLRGKRRAREYR